MTTTATVSPTGNAYVDGILSGTMWGTTSLTYSFPTSASYYTGFFGAYGSGEPSNGFKPFNSVQQAAVTSILGMYSSVANLTFTQIAETSTQSATLRYAESNSPTTAWTYYPSTSPEGGDAWFNASSGWYNNPVVGNYAWLTIMHETGHALGLKHPQDTLGSFNTMPADGTGTATDHDSLEYTVMSYRSYIGASVTGGLSNASDSFPQSLMMYDIAAVQAMYGADYKTNSGNTVYSWSPTTGQEFINGVAQAMPVGNKIFMTVWDGGGTDTYDFSNYKTNLSVNLQPGGWTVASTTQLAYLGAGHYAIGNIANALEYQNNPASLIENAIGGSGNDTIIGNAANNTITGGGGNDTIDGVSGVNTAVYSGKSTDYKVSANSDGSYTVTDMRTGSPDGADTLKNIEYLKFSDTTVAIGSAPQQPTLQAPSITSFSPDSAIVGDGITDAKVLTLTGTGTVGTTVKIYDGATLIGSTTVSITGAWSFATSSLADGTHNFTATATDSSGNTSPASSATNVIVDTAVPVTPTVSMQSVDSNVVGDHVTNVNVISLTGTAEANSSIRVYDGTTLLGSAVANAAGVWNFVPDLSGDQAAAPHSPATITGVVENARGLAKIHGTAAPNAKVSILDASSKAVVGTATADASGNWTFVDSHAKGVHFMVEGSGGSLTTGAATTSNTTQPFSFTTAPLANGVHNFSVTSTDAAGNVSSSSAVLSVTIDTTAPTAPSITAFSPDSATAGDGITSANVVTVTGAAEAGSTVKVYDGATLLGTVTANGTGAWSLTTGQLANGTHSLTATATDLAGNVSGASGALNVTVDTVAPTTPSIVSFSPDSGTVGDGITSANVVTVTGAAEAGSTVKVYDGATLLGTVTANGTGAWSLTTGQLANGTHSLTATATDLAGNVSGASGALNVTVDTVAPTTPSIVSFSPDSGTVGDGITSANVVTVTGAAEAGSTVKVYDGTTLLGTATANGTGAWSLTTGQLANGTHSLTATATDLAGNVSGASGALNVTVDTVAPTTPSIVSFSPDSGTVGDGITSANVVTVTGAAEAGSTVKVYDGATLLGTVTANGTGAWSLTTGQLANGTHSLTATATDLAGNVSGASGALNVTVDTVAPTTPSIVSFSPDSGTVGDGITSANVVTVTGAAEAGSTVKVYDGATLLGTVTANGTGAWSLTSGQLANGTHSLTATATDLAGNVSGASGALNVTVDTVAPTTPSIVSFSPDSGTVGDGITSANVVTVTGAAEAGSTVKVYDGATLLGTVTANGTGAWSLTSGQLANGTHSLTATATDLAGNVSGTSGALNVTVDTVAPTAPSITAFTPDTGVVGDSVTSANIVTVSGAAEANSAVKVYDGATLLGTANVNSSGAWSFTTAALVSGSHSFTATATDAAGNVSSASAATNVTVEAAPGTPAITSVSPDTALPNDGLTNASVLTVTGAAEAGSTVKVYDGTALLGSVVAGSTGAWSFTTAALANGTHSFTATATSLGGTTSAASTSVNMTVDTVAPTTPSIASFSPDSGTVGDGITSANVVTVTGAAEAGSAVKVYDGTTLLGTATANGTGAWSLTTGQLANGTHSLTATATDLAGNVSTASGALNVTVDTAGPTPPTITAYTPDTGLAGDGVTSAKVITVSGAAEAGSTVKIYDGSALIGSTIATGSGAWTFKTPALSDGTHSISATATDAAGNVSGSSTVLVGNASSTALTITVDTVAPVAPMNMSFSPDSGIVGDGITNASVVVINGLAEAGSTVKLYDGTSFLGSALASATGAWSFSTAALADGSHSLTATATDLAGNVSVASSGLDVTVDAVAPIVPTITSFSPDSAVVGDGSTNANHVTLTGAAEANSSVKIYDGNMLVGSAVANSNGAWSFNSGALADGMHNFTTTDTDAAGNVSASSSVMHVNVDTAAPVAPVISSFSPDTATIGDGVTKADVLTLSGAAEAGSTVKVYDGATLLGTALAGSNGAWTYTTGALSDGLHAFTSTDTDVAGNTSVTSAALHVNVDTVAPNVPTVTGFSPDTGTLGDGITTASVLTVTGSGETNSTIKLYDGSSLLGTAAVDGNGAWSLTTQSLSAGTHNFTATDVDAAGNVSGVSGGLAVDVQGISIGINTTSYLSNLRGLGLLSGTTEANSSLTISDSLSGKILAQVVANSTGSFSGLMSGLTNTVHSFDVLAKDALGNTGTQHLVVGSTANDILVGTSASEVFVGHGGNDSFVFSGNFGKDAITDFQASRDTIQLDHSAFADFASVLSHATQVGSDIVIAQDAHDAVTLHNTALSQLTSQNFHLV